MEYIQTSTYSQQGGGLRAFRVVLYRNHKAEFVVHYEAKEGDRWHGGYHDTLEAALKDYNDRLALKGLRNL